MITPTVKAAAALGKALTVLHDAGMMDFMAAVGAVMSTPANSPERLAALDAFQPQDES